MSEQLFEDGKVVVVDGTALECVAVTYQEDPETQERHSFAYSFRPKSEVDAEREAARIAQEEAEAEINKIDEGEE